LLTIKEVAQTLHVSRSLVYLLVQRGEIATVRLGNALCVHPDDLEGYIYKKRLDYGKNAQEFLKRWQARS
jgi:excisionase family DNA binding protein